MKLVHTCLSWWVRAVIFLFPFFFLPFTTDFFDFNKIYLLTFGSVFGLLLWAIAHTRGDFKLRLTPYDLPVLGIALVTLASAFIVTPNRTDAFLFPGTATVITAGALLYFIINQTQLFEAEEERRRQFPSIADALIRGTAVAALFTTLATAGFFGIVGELFGAPAWFTQNSFNVTGGYLPAITLFAALLPIVVLRAVKAPHARHMAVNVVILVILVVALSLSVYAALPGRATSVRILPVSTGWGIALETLKQSPFLGVGMGNFAEAFNRFRSLDFNSTDVWNLRFVASSNWYLHLWTISGLLGLASFLWLVFAIVKHVRHSNISGVNFSLLTILIIFLLVPANTALIIAFFVLLALSSYPLGRDVGLRFAASSGQHRTNLLPGVIAILALAAFVGLGFIGSRVYAAEAHYKKALDAVKSNNARVTYDELAAAVRINPYVPHYRAIFSQTNLLIANAMAGNENITEEDKQTISQLIQQAIREGQAAVALNRNRSDNWENLGRIYQSLIPLAQGTDQYAISTYQQAIALDPTNPLLRVALGGVYYSLKQYDEAIRVFELAVAAKPNYANAHYNLAAALRENGDYNRALQEMTTTLSLLEPQSPDRSAAQRELDALRTKVSEESTSSGQPAGGDSQPPLQAPPSSEGTSGPTIDLPPNAAPPATDAGEPTPIPAP